MSEPVKPLSDTDIDWCRRSDHRGSNYTVARLLATLDAERAKRAEVEAERDAAQEHRLVHEKAWRNATAALAAERTRREHAESLLGTAVATIEGLADQQAMSADWYEEPLATIRAAWETAKRENQ